MYRDALLVIFDRCSLKTLVNCRRVSKIFKEVLDKKQFLGVCPSDGAVDIERLRGILGIFKEIKHIHCMVTVDSKDALILVNLLRNITLTGRINIRASPFCALFVNVVIDRFIHLMGAFTSPGPLGVNYPRGPTAMEYIKMNNLGICISVVEDNPCFHSEEGERLERREYPERRECSGEEPGERYIVKECVACLKNNILRISPANIIHVGDSRVMRAVRKIVIIHSKLLPDKIIYPCQYVVTKGLSKGNICGKIAQEGKVCCKKCHRKRFPGKDAHPIKDISHLFKKISEWNVREIYIPANYYLGNPNKEGLSIFRERSCYRS